MDVQVRPGREEDEAVWRDLWQGYLEFYEASVSEAVTATTWQRMHDPASPVGLLVAETDGEVVGFASYVAHPATWDETDRCYLEDLFVRPDARGTGAGRALLDAVVELARREGWSTVYWHTREDNARARRLYDHYAEADGFVRYVIDLPG